MNQQGVKNPPGFWFGPCDLSAKATWNIKAKN